MNIKITSLLSLIGITVVGCLFEWNCDGYNARSFEEQCINPYVKKLVKAENEMVKDLHEEILIETNSLVVIAKLFKRHLQLDQTVANTKILQALDQQITKLVDSTNDTEAAFLKSSGDLSSVVNHGFMYWHAGGSYVTTVVAVGALLLSLFNTSFILCRYRQQQNSTNINLVPTTCTD